MAENKKPDNSNFVPGALKWLYEMEMVDDDNVKNNLYTNIFCQSKRIKDVELIIDSRNRKILILVEFNIFGRIFKRSRLNTVQDIIDGIQQLLPRFAVRLITKRSIFEQSLKLVTEDQERKDHVNSIDSGDSDNEQSGDGESSELRETSTVLSDQEEQAETE